MERLSGWECLVLEQTRTISKMCMLSWYVNTSHVETWSFSSTVLRPHPPHSSPVFVPCGFVYTTRQEGRLKWFNSALFIILKCISVFGTITYHERILAHWAPLEFEESWTGSFLVLFCPKSLWDPNLFLVLRDAAKELSPSSKTDHNLSSLLCHYCPYPKPPHLVELYT